MAPPKKRRKYHRRTTDEIIAELEARIATLREKARGADRFSPAEVRSERERLGLSAADYGELIGVSSLTVYNWEKGKTRPRTEQLGRWLEVRGIKQQDAWAELGLESDFSPEDVRAERDRLELSAADYAELVGVSMLTIYNWEKGKSEPRAKQLEKLDKVRGIGKRKAWKKLGLV